MQLGALIRQELDPLVCHSFARVQGHELDVLTPAADCVQAAVRHNRAGDAKRRQLRAMARNALDRRVCDLRPRFEPAKLLVHPSLIRSSAERYVQRVESGASAARLADIADEIDHAC